MHGRFLNALKSSYNGSSAYKRVNGGISERFELSVGVYQGCLLMLKLFNIFKDVR